MSAGGSEGAGDRGVSGVALRAASDRLAHRDAQSSSIAGRGRVRRAEAVLLGLDLRRVAQVGLVVDDAVPQILMFAGDPFLISGADDKQPLTYLQVRPYRVDALVTGEVTDGR